MGARGDLSQLEKGAATPQPTAVVKIFCLDLSRASRLTQLILCSAAVFLFYVVYGYMQELIFRLPGFRPFGWYLTLIQFSIYSVLGFMETSFSSKVKARRIPIRTYIQLAFFTVATMGLSNASVGHLNYPTQVIFKCCKLIPVLIGGVFIQGKRISLLDFTAALLMSVGLILFSLTDSKVSPNFDTQGYIMISFALVADAVIGNVQEKAMKAHSAQNCEVVLYSYSIGCLYIFIGTLVTGEFWEALNFCSQYPKETYGYAFFFSIAGYLGINVVLTLVKSFGAFIAVTVTTCRKAVTIILSFLFFSKPFSPNYIWSGCIVLLGIYLNVYSKNRQEWDKKLVVIMQKLISSCQSWKVRRQSISSQIV